MPSRGHWTTAGWSVAESVADADVLAVVGQPGTELMVTIDHAWDQMSEPRVRVEVYADSDVAQALAQASQALRAPEPQRSRAGQRRSRQSLPPDQHDSHQHEPNGGGDHDHGDMSPDGIPLAEGADDRDGLEMDELHLPLGPVLAHWPAGVVLRLTLHGDVVAGAEVDQLASGSDSAAKDSPTVRAARLLDAAASVLALAGLPSEAARTRRLRDACLDGAWIDAAAIAGLAMRIRRNRVLRWMLDGLTLTRPGSSPEELTERLTGLLDRARAALDGDAESAQPAGPPLESLPELVRGRELAAVRLWACRAWAGSHQRCTGGGGRWLIPCHGSTRSPCWRGWSWSR